MTAKPGEALKTPHAHPGKAGAINPLIVISVSSMKKLSLPIHPKEAAAKVMKLLPTSRLRDVVERRFGLRGKEPETLETIGRSFGITRERVRQLEADGLKHIAKPEATEALAPVLAALEKHFEDHGHVFEESKLLASAAEPRFSNHIYFFLTVGRPFGRRGEDESWHERWYTKEEALKAAQSIVTRTAGELSGIGKPVAASELFNILKAQTRDALGVIPSNPDLLDSYLSISKLIKQNPYGEFGLVSWPTIHPRGVRDKAYAVMARAGAPMHFREVAAAVSKSGWSSKKAHPQTVHNELIKDPRFVLVGRGIYGLAESGYTPGTVSEVIVSVLKASKEPMGKDTIIKRVLEARLVKPNTVFLNLQNRRLFRKTPEGYDLA